MSERLKLLILTKKFAEKMPKHQHKYDMITAIEAEADVRYWHQDGNIQDILAELDFTPDFIFHYDIEWHNAFAPKISGLPSISIPKGCYVLDVHYAPQVRKAYFNQSAKPDLIFSASKYPFLKAFPDCASRFEWLPFGINPDIIKDYGLAKTFRYSLAGLVDSRYVFRQEVLKQMRGEEGFVHFSHPGHLTPQRPGLFINEKYASALNQSMISFTCGSKLQIPVAKFFELPGCRTLMLAENNPDIEELGFKDRENYAACDIENVRDKALYYANAAEEREALTLAGYSFIHQHHTNQVRAKQFVAAIRRYISA